MNLGVLASSGKSEVVDISAADHLFAGGPVRGISFGVAGDLIVIRTNDTEDTIPEGALAAGVIHPLEAKGIKRTGTLADDIVGHY